MGLWERSWVAFCVRALRNSWSSTDSHPHQHQHSSLSTRSQRSVCQRKEHNTSHRITSHHITSHHNTSQYNTADLGIVLHEVGREAHRCAVHAHRPFGSFADIALALNALRVPLSKISHQISLMKEVPFKYGSMLHQTKCLIEYIHYA